MFVWVYTRAAGSNTDGQVFNNLELFKKIEDHSVLLIIAKGSTISSWPVMCSRSEHGS